MKARRPFKLKKKVLTKLSFGPFQFLKVLIGHIFLLRANVTVLKIAELSMDSRNLRTKSAGKKWIILFCVLVVFPKKPH